MDAAGLGLPFPAWLGAALCSCFPGLPACCPWAPGSVREGVRPQEQLLGRTEPRQPRSREGSGRSCACSGISSAGLWGFCSCLWQVKCSIPSLQTLQGAEKAGRRGNAGISSGRWLLEELPKCIPEWCWQVPSRSLERQQGQGFSSCICPISMSSFGVTLHPGALLCLREGELQYLGT